MYVYRCLYACVHVYVDTFANINIYGCMRVAAHAARDDGRTSMWGKYTYVGGSEKDNCT